MRSPGKRSVIRTAQVLRARWEIRYLWEKLRVEPETRSSPLPKNIRDEAVREGGGWPTHRPSRNREESL
jgi:hypothetical protein